MKAKKKSPKRNRLNITLSKDVQAFLEVVAEAEGVPLATKASDLLKEALKIHEDEAFLAVMKKRESESDEKFLTHEEVWG